MTLRRRIMKCCLSQEQTHSSGSLLQLVIHLNPSDYSLSLSQLQYFGEMKREFVILNH